MNSRAPLLGAVAVLSFFAGATGIRLAYTLAYALILTLAVACGWSWLVVRRVVITRTSPEGTVMVGEPFVESFTVHNQGVLPVAYCEVYDLSTVGGYYPGRACALRGGDTVGWTARGVFARRGHHNFGPLEARLGDPFGLFPRTIRVAPVRSVTVYPRIHHIEDLGAVWSGGSNGDIGHGRIVDAPPDVATVREYLPEDGFGRIHWRSTARTGRLMSRSFDTRNSADVLIVLDLQAGTHAGVAPESSLEYAISLAGSVCHSALRRGQAVGLVTNDASATAFGAGRGEAHRLRILDYLATTTADGVQPIGDTIRRHSGGWRGRGGLVVITATNDLAWVEALLDAGVRGQRHVAVLVDPASFGGSAPGFRPPAAWRLALDWWVIRRGDPLSAPVATRTATL